MALINNVNELNERITILSVKPSGGPEPGDEEKELFSCWAKIRTQYIKDIKDYSGTAFEDTTEIVIRQLQKYQVTNKMKIRWKNKTYNIVKVNPDNATKEFMVLVVKLEKQ